MKWFKKCCFCGGRGDKSITVTGKFLFFNKTLFYHEDCMFKVLKEPGKYNIDTIKKAISITSIIKNNYDKYTALIELAHSLYNGKESKLRPVRPVIPGNTFHA
ncbi:MAG: hypothetical protein KKB59_18240 [Spirochaetes bacterium]|nr:hypothetical protein [Spirochaetota bacterium]